MPGPRSCSWEAAVLGAGAWVCPDSAVLSSLPHPGAKFCSASTSACGKGWGLRAIVVGLRN